MHVTGRHQLLPIREDTDDRGQDSVALVVPRPDWRTFPPCVTAMKRIVGPRSLRGVPYLRDLHRPERRRSLVRLA